MKPSIRTWQAREIVHAGVGEDGGRATWSEAQQNGALDALRLENWELKDRIVTLLAELFRSSEREVFGLCLSIEEALTNVVRYGKHPDPNVPQDLTRFQVVLELKRTILGTKKAILSVFDQGPDLQMTPEEYAAASVAPENLESNHGRGFTLILEMGKFQVKSERIDEHQKVLRFTKSVTLLDSLTAKMAVAWKKVGPVLSFAGRRS